MVSFCHAKLNWRCQTALSSQSCWLFGSTPGASPPAAGLQLPLQGSHPTISIQTHAALQPFPPPPSAACSESKVWGTESSHMAKHKGVWEIEGQILKLRGKNGKLFCHRHKSIQPKGPSISWGALSMTLLASQGKRLFCSGVVSSWALCTLLVTRV